MGGNQHNGNGQLHDDHVPEPTPVKARQQKPLDSVSLVDIVERYLEGFHHPQESGVLDQFGARIHAASFGEIVSRLNLDMAREIQPVVEFVWNIRPAYKNKGFKLLGFKNTNGFGSMQYQHEHSVFGNLFCSTDIAVGRGTPSHREFVQEGTYYFTFILYRSGRCGWFDRYEGPIQFTEAVPSRQWALAQLNTQHKINDLGRKEQIESEQHKSTLWKAQKTYEDLTGADKTRLGNPVDQAKARLAQGAQDAAEIEMAIQEALHNAREALFSSPSYVAATDARKRALERDLEISFSHRRNTLHP